MTISNGPTLPTASNKAISAVATDVTIKGPSLDGGLSRYEFEKEITAEEAEQLFNLCEPGIIDKTRYLVKSGDHTFEVDEFYGENEGLVMAEVELSTPDEIYKKPDIKMPFM